MSIPKLGIVNERQDFKDEFKLKPYCRVNKNDDKYLIFGLDKSNCVINPDIQNLISKNKIKLITEIICKPTFLCYRTENFNPLAIEKNEFSDRIEINSYVISSDNFRLNKVLLSPFWFDENIFYKNNQKISEEFSLIVNLEDNFIKGNELDFVSLKIAEDPDMNFDIDLHSGDQIVISLEKKFYDFFVQRMNDNNINILLGDVITSQAIILGILELMKDEESSDHISRKWYRDLKEHLNDRGVDLSESFEEDNKYNYATKIYNQTFGAGDIKINCLNNLIKIME